MRRIVEPERTLYIDRHLGWSLLFLASAVMAVGLAADATAPALDRFFWITGLVLLAVALDLLFRKRAIVIDRNASALVVIHRTLFGSRETRARLDQVAVTLRRRTIRHTVPTRGESGHILARLQVTNAIWIERRGSEDLLFLDAIGGDEGELLARRLADDLARPLHVIDQSE